MKPAGIVDSRNQPAAPQPRHASEITSDIPGQIIVGILTAVGEPDRNAQGQTVIVVPELTNYSSAPGEGVVQLGSQLRRELAAAGEASELVFIEPASLSSPAAAHYILEGSAYTLQRSGQRYWEVFFTLYDVDHQTGARHNRRWENTRGYLVPR